MRAVHATGAYLHLGPPASDEAVAQRLADTAPRALLKMVIPGADLRLFRALDRCGPSILSATCYGRLAAVAGSPLIEVLLVSDKPVDASYIRYVAKLVETDAAIRRLPSRLLADQSATEAVLAAVALLRAHGLDLDRALAGLPSAAGWEAVYRRLMNSFGALDSPPVARPLPLSLRQITTVAGLREAGRALGLCVWDATHGGADHWMRLVAGSSIYIAVDEPRMLLELRRVAPDLWMIGEAKQSHNRMAPPGTMRALVTAFVAAGWRFVETDPVAALVTLACRSDSNFAEWDRTLGQMLQELDHEWA